jgi:hypothetical protein
LLLTQLLRDLLLWVLRRRGQDPLLLLLMVIAEAHVPHHVVLFLYVHL